MASQIIDKLDAACRQLNTAISLWFNNGDAVSIHTLTCSAYQVVHDINRRSSEMELLYDSIIVKDEYRREWVNNLKQEYNFFKHADNDPEGTVEFDPVITEFFIIFTSLGLERLGRKPDEVRSAFNIYFCFRHPDSLTAKGKAELDSLPEKTRESARTMPKEKFFETYILLRKLYAAGPKPV